jgi:hypothetical protein
VTKQPDGADHPGEDREPHAGAGTPPASPDRIDWRLWGVAFVAALALYVLTAHRGVQWQDAGIQQLRILTGQIENVRGLALVHPVQYWLGRAAIQLPGLEPAFAVTLVSALAGALAVANLAAVLRLLTRSWTATFIATTTLALSHTFWQHATHTESYAIVAALLTGEWLMLTAFARTRWPGFLLWLALLSGLGVANHLLAGLVVPVNVAVILWCWRRGWCTGRTFLLATVLWIVGTLPYSVMVLQEAIQTGDLMHAIRSALVGNYADEVLNTRLGARMLALSAALVVYNLPNLTLPLAFLGLNQARREGTAPRWVVRVLVVEFVILGGFIVRYPITDQYTYYFPVYLLLAIFAGLAIEALGRSHPTAKWRRLVIGVAAVTALWTPAVYWSAAQVARSQGWFASMVKNKPYRDGYATFFLPWGVGDRTADQLNTQAADLAGENGSVLIADRMIVDAMRYAQARGHLADDVEIEPIRPQYAEDEQAAWRERLTEALAAGRPVVLVPRNRDNPKFFLSDATWQRHGDLYVLERLGENTSTPSPPEADTP